MSSKDSDYYGYSPYSNIFFWAAPLYRAQVVVQTQDLISSIPKEKSSRGILSYLKEILAKESSLFLFRGNYAYMALLWSNSVLRGKFVNKAEEITRPNFKYLAATPDVVTSVAIAAWNLITHPIEVLRVRMSCDNLGVPEKLYGINKTISNLVKKEGMRVFYRGYGPTTAYYVIQQDLIIPKDEDRQLKPGTIVNRIARDLILYPLLVVSHRMIVSGQNSNNGYPDLRTCIRDTYKKFGINGFYRGFWVNLFLHSFVLYQRHQNSQSRK